MSEPDIVRDILSRVEAAGCLADLSTAERRKALDDALRAELSLIDDPSLRAHAAEMIRLRRQKMFGGEDLWRRVGRLETVVAALEQGRVRGPSS
jgi:hypothetical protein